MLRQAHERYARAQELTRLPVVYCSASAKIDVLLAELERLRPEANLGPGVGRWAPGQVTLLVASHADDPSSDRRFPFVDFTLKKEGCSAWLAEQLEAGGIGEDTLYWINAWDAERNWTDPEFLDALRPLRVVALGDVAARWCGVVARVPHREVFHPQAWKRFHRAQPYPLIDLLKENPYAKRQDAT